MPYMMQKAWVQYLALQDAPSTAPQAQSHTESPSLWDVVLTKNKQQSKSLQKLKTSVWGEGESWKWTVQ